MGTDVPARRYPGRVRTGLALGVVGLSALTLAACGSSGSGHATASGSSAAPASSLGGAVPTSASAPPASPSATGPTPITLPSQSPAAVISRKVTRPAGLSPIDGTLCINSAVTGADILIRKAMTDYSDLPEQINQVGAAAGVLTSVVLPATKKARAALLRAHYPASFAAVRDFTTLIPLETAVVNAYHAQNLNSIPSTWLKLTTAGKQYLADSSSAYRSGRDFCST